MAAFVAKQMMGSKLNAVKGAVSSSDGGNSERDEEAERERLEAIAEAEERRKEKHRKMEEERERMRQEIREKYNIPKKSSDASGLTPDASAMTGDSSLNRRKKTPEELQAEAELADADDFTRFKNQIESHFLEIKSQIEARCSIQ